MKAISIKKATDSDLERLMDIYAYARDFMARTGNPHQWGDTNWPSREVILKDIAAGEAYVILAPDGHIAGAFVYRKGPVADPCYREISDGAWRQERPYGVVHRLAGDGSVKGLAQMCFDWAYTDCGYLRVDTHPDNHVMQKILEDRGFVYCGVIHVEHDDHPRLAYDRI